MSKPLTVKNIPDAVYDRLKRSAEAHRRSLNSEVIACLESVLPPTRAGTSDLILRARALRATLEPGKFHPRDIDELKRLGKARVSGA